MDKYWLFLDDFRTPIIAFGYKKNWKYLEHNRWIIVRSYNEFVEFVEGHYRADGSWPELISWDHDLADAHYDPETWTENFVYQEKTGHDAAKWLVEFCLDNNLKLPDYLVHSMNPGGADNINGVLSNFKKFQSTQ